MKGEMSGAKIMKFVWRGGCLCMYIVLSLLIIKGGSWGYSPKSKGSFVERCAVHAHIKTINNKTPELRAISHELEIQAFLIRSPGRNVLQTSREISDNPPAKFAICERINPSSKRLLFVYRLTRPIENAKDYRPTDSRPGRQKLELWPFRAGRRVGCENQYWIYTLTPGVI